MVKSQLQQSAVIVAYSSYYEAIHKDDYTLKYELDRPVAFMADNNADTMQFDQAVQAPESAEFTKVCIKEVNNHVKCNHWQIIPRFKIPTGTKILSSVWSLRHKRNLATGEVYKHKARPNVHSGDQ